MCLRSGFSEAEAESQIQMYMSYWEEWGFGMKESEGCKAGRGGRGAG